MNESLLAVARTYVTAATAFAAEMNRAQAELDLAQIFEPDELASADGRRRSHARLARLNELLGAHKVYFSRFVPSHQQALIAARGELLAADGLDEALARLQAHIDSQAHAWQLREEWMGLVASLLDLFAANADTVFIESGSLCVEDEAVLGEMQGLSERIDAVAAAETALLRQRLQELACAANAFGIAPGAG